MKKPLFVIEILIFFSWLFSNVVKWSGKKVKNEKCEILMSKMKQGI